MPGDTAEQGVMDGDFSIGKHAEWRCDVISVCVQIWGEFWRPALTVQVQVRVCPPPDGLGWGWEQRERRRDHPPDPKQSPLVVVAFTPRAGYMCVQ